MKANACSASLESSAGRRDALRELVAAKARLLVPLTAIYLVAYLGLTTLAGYAKPLLAAKVAGPLNFGLLLIMLNYVLACGLAVLYVKVANAVFDPEVAKLRDAVAKGRREP